MALCVSFFSTFAVGLFVSNLCNLVPITSLNRASVKGMIEEKMPRLASHCLLGEFKKKAAFDFPLPHHVANHLHPMQPRAQASFIWPVKAEGAIVTSRNRLKIVLSARITATLNSVEHERGFRAKCHVPAHARGWKFSGSLLEKARKSKGVKLLPDLKPASRLLAQQRV